MLNEALHDTTDLAMNNSRYHHDDRLLVKFFMHPRLNQVKTKEAGRPIYEEKPYIQIMQPGNKDSIVIRPARDMDKHRFAEHWRKFEARESQDTVEGTRLEDWPAITRSQAEELKFLNVKTVEQLAGMSDVNAQNVMGLNMLKQKAVKFMETSAANATAEKFADLEAKYESLVQKMDGKNVDPIKPKRKRRSKAEMEAAKGEEKAPQEAA